MTLIREEKVDTRITRERRNEIVRERTVGERKIGWERKWEGRGYEKCSELLSYFFFTFFQDVERLEAKMRTRKLTSPFHDNRMTLQEDYLTYIRFTFPDWLEQHHKTGQTKN